MTDYFQKAAYTPSKWGVEFHGRKEQEAFGAGAAGPGKALGLQTLVPTPIGFRYFGDLRPGDTVYNVQGQKVKVVAETPIWENRDCFEILVADEKIICDGEHLWCLQDGRIQTAFEIHNSVFNTQLSFANCVEMDSARQLLDPYVYGLCLVRGQPSDRSKMLLWHADLFHQLACVGYTLDDVGFKAAQVRERRELINELIPAKGRRIHKEYLYASFNQRMAVVEGIMDANGGRCPEVDYEDYPFLTDFYCLCASLGLGPQIKRTRYGKTYYVEIFSKDYKCSRLDGNAGATRRRRSAHRIKRIKRCVSVPTKCIQVECGGTFLITKSYIPTHNSMVLLMDPVEQIQVEHLRCQQDDKLLAKSGLDPDMQELIRRNPIRWGHSEGWVLHLRRTLPRLSETINRAHRIFPQLDPEAKWNEKNHFWTFSSGIKYEFGHCKDRTDYNNYLGKQYSHLGFDELVEFDKEQYDFICSRLRTGDPVLEKFLKIRAMSNPKLGGNKGEDIVVSDPAWVKRYFVDPAPEGRKVLRKKIVRQDGRIEYVTRIYIPATLYDNPDKRFVEQYELQLMSRPKHIRDAYLFGRWDAIMGSHFGETWNPTVHVCKPFKIPHDWPIFRAGDWGYATHGTVGWYAVHPEGTLYCFYELSFKHKTATDVAEMVKYFEEKNKLWDPNSGSKITGPMDRQLWEERGSSFKNKAEEMSDVGVNWVKADQKSREVNCEVFTQRLLAHENFTKLPGIVFFENCDKSIKTIPALNTDSNNPEVPLKGGEDHWYDRNTYACQYAKMQGMEPPKYKSKHYDDEDDHPPDNFRDTSYSW